MILQHTKAGGRTVAYWIFIFNQREIATIDEAALIQAVTASNYATLSAQYGLDPHLIAPALAHLKVVTSERAACPFFLLRYLPEPQQPLAFYQWDGHSEIGSSLLKEALDGCESEEIRRRLAQTRQINAIELSALQLQDMGLLLAYELARWSADQGEGVLRGIDGNWYRLNRHQAFIRLHLE